MTDLEQKPRPADMSFRFIGQPIVRKEDARLTTGRGRFSDDFSVKGQAYAVMLRSPHAHARILGIDARRATAMPGVLGVFTGADCLADGLTAIPHDPLPKTKYDMKLQAAGGGALFIGPHLLLPADKARHVGEAVAMVVAETVAQALDAAECVDVEYDVLPGVYHSEDAMRSGAPAVWSEVADNIAVDTSFGNREATDEAFARADRIVAMDFHIDRVTGVPLEPRSENTTQRAGATRSMPAAAARCGRSASLPPCSASRRSSCASSPTTSAAISARATARSSSSAWCCGPRASSAVQSSSPPPAPRRSSATIRDATSSPGWSWRSPGTAASSPCARPTSAMWARAACRSRRFPRAPA